jgi:excisionase family DNA binding protein
VNSTEYLSLPQVAAELKCSVRTVRRYLKEGRLGYSQEKKGGVIRVSREDIAAYYQASRRGPAVPRRRSARAA